MPTLLAVIPHPDDESYSFGGTIALAASAGWRCVVHCASSGERGERHDGARATPATLGPVREDELRESCRILGAEPPEFWRLPDGGLSAPRDRTPINAMLSGLQPDVILALGPDGAYGHPDHIAVHNGVAAWWRSLPGERPALLFAAFPRGLFLPQYEKCIAMMGDPPQPAPEAIGSHAFDYAIDVSRVRAAKLAAIASHRTQLPGRDPRRLFPAGIVEAVLDVERFGDATGRRDGRVAELLASLG